MRSALETRPADGTSRPLAWFLLFAAGLCVFTRLLPESYRLLNLHPVGAMALFAGARCRSRAAFALPFLVMAFSDLVLWKRGYWMFDPFVYLSFALYVWLGASALRNTESPVRVGACAVGASSAFFLITNFGAWLSQALPYGYTLGGLLECYAMALPFHKGILFGDLGFSAILFGAYAVLTRTAFTDERVAALQTQEVDP